MTTTRTARHDIERIPVTVLADGRPVELTVHRLVGAHDGPKFVMFGGVHGDEPLAPEAVRRVTEAVDPEQLRGELVVVPVANPLAFFARRRRTPDDGLDLDLTYPGNPEGSVTEQISAALTAILRDDVDYFIDFHSGGDYACVDYSFVFEESRTISTAWGSKVLYLAEPDAASDFIRNLGIQYTVTELGGSYQDVDEHLERAVSGTLNTLRAVGMLPGEAAKTEGQVVVTSLTTVRPATGGSLLSEFTSRQLGVEVAGGTLLGTVVSPYDSTVLEELRAPFERSILVLTRERVTSVNPGDFGFMVADAATAVPAE